MNGAKSMHMEKRMLLEKMDVRRLKQKLENKHEYYSHEHKCCRCIIKLLWKVKGAVKKGGIGSSWNAVHAYRHLEKGHNEAGRNSIKEKILERAEKISSMRKMHHKRKRIFK